MNDLAYAYDWGTGFPKDEVAAAHTSIKKPRTGATSGGLTTWDGCIKPATSCPRI